MDFTTFMHGFAASVRLAFHRSQSPPKKHKITHVVGVTAPCHLPLFYMPRENLVSRS